MNLVGKNKTRSLFKSIFRNLHLFVHLDLNLLILDIAFYWLRSIWLSYQNPSY